jgi:hypothetical protein
MFRIETRNPPRSKLVKDADEASCVRVYKHSPEDLMLQIWSGKRYMMVALFPEEARAIAAQLVAAADAVEGPTERLHFKNCPDCGVAPGELHTGGCDVERCPECGLQAFSCDHDAVLAEAPRRMPWTGEYPGAAQCRELGWYARPIQGQGWVPCSADDEGAFEDINRLISGHWNAKTQRWEAR